MSQMGKERGKVTIIPKLELEILAVMFLEASRQLLDAADYQTLPGGDAFQLSTSNCCGC